MYRYPFLNDLSWLLEPKFDLLERLAPYSRFIPNQTQQYITTWLQTLENKAEIPSLFTVKTARLGNYFENLVAFYLSEFYEGLERNIVIRDPNNQQKSTVGEMDFLFMEGTVKTHLEVAVKFYLGIKINGETRWIGPNANDSLDKKLKHLQEHQLKLSNHELSDHKDAQKKFWVKGYLFEPWGESLNFPEGIFKPESHNLWISQNRMVDFFNSNPYPWRILEKTHWLGNAFSTCTKYLNTEPPIHQLREYLEKHNRSIQCVNLDTQARLFITPESWLTEASQSCLTQRQ